MRILKRAEVIVPVILFLLFATFVYGEWKYGTVTIDDSGSINIPTGQSYKINSVAVIGDSFAAMIASTAPNKIWGRDGSATLGEYSNIKMDDSAAQFYSATASKGELKFDQTGLSSGITLTYINTATGSLTFTPTFTGTTAITYPTSGTLATLAGTEKFTNKALEFVEVDGSATGSLSAANVSRTMVNSYGRSAAATLTLPAAASGYSFIAIVGTKHNSAWKIQRAGADTIYWDAAGVLTAGKTYFQETNQEVGSRVSCSTFRTGASAWSWLCGSVSGTWTTD